MPPSTLIRSQALMFISTNVIQSLSPRMTAERLFFFLIIIIILKKFNLFKFIVEAGGGRVHRKKDSESKAGSRFQAVNTEPNARLEPTNRTVRS